MNISSKKKTRCHPGKKDKQKKTARMSASDNVVGTKAEDSRVTPAWFVKEMEKFTASIQVMPAGQLEELDASVEKLERGLNSTNTNMTELEGLRLRTDSFTQAISNESV